jgi:hypothetical protein
MVRGILARKTPSSSPSSPSTCPAPLRTLYGADFDVVFTLPEVREARFSVTAVEVMPGEYNGTDLHRPRLYWEISLGDRTLRTSTVRSSDFSARWSEWTPWTPMTSDEEIYTCIEAKGLLVPDDVGCLHLSLDAALAAAKSHQALSAGRVSAPAVGRRKLTKSPRSDPSTSSMPSRR